VVRGMMVMMRRRAMCRVRFVRRALLNVGIFVRESCVDAGEILRRDVETCVTDLTSASLYTHAVG
jgi:hypothetical protein